MTAPRDYLDDIDIDEAVDILRACRERDKAREFYVACLKVAYQQGRVDRAKETHDDAVKLIAEYRNGDNPAGSL